MEFPLKFASDYSIRDANDKVICPCIIYRSDKYHIDEQIANGNMIVSELNNKHGYFLNKEKKWERLDDMALKTTLEEVNGETVTVEEPVNGKLHKSRKK